MTVKSFVWILPTLAAVVLVLSGYFAGQHSVISPFRAELTHYDSTETLGQVLAHPVIAADLTDRQRTMYHQAYRDGDAIEQRVHDIAWGVRNVPAPFVGSLPWPGVQHNAVINRDQFRYERELVVPKPPGTYRVFLTGGSTAFGSGAPTQDMTIGMLLERLLRERLQPMTGGAYEVLTFANPAWSSTHERIAINNRLADLEPDMIISFSGNNDVFWGAAGRNVLWFRTAAEDFFWRLIDGVYRAAAGRALHDVIATDTEPVPPSLVAQRLYRNVRLAHNGLQLARQGAEYVFVLQPTLAVTGKPLTPREADFLNEQQPYYQESYRAITEALKPLRLPGFRFLDFAPVFDELPRDDVFIDSFHFGDIGNLHIAEALFERLFKEGLPAGAGKSSTAGLQAGLPGDPQCQGQLSNQSERDVGI